MYPTQQVAEDALIEAHIRFTYAQGYGPVGIYRCDDCGLFHLTSKGPENERLLQARKAGEISRQKQANEWARRLNK